MTDILPSTDLLPSDSLLLGSGTLTLTSERLYGALGPLTAPDEQNGYPLRALTAAVGEQIDPLATVVTETDTGPGWSSILDLTRAPGWALRWLGQFVGVQVPATVDETTARTVIGEESGFGRGTVAAIKAAALRFMRPGRAPIILERDGGAYRLTVRAYTTWLTGATYAELSTEYPTYTALAAAFPTYDVMAATATEFTAAVLAAKPAGLLMTVDIETTATYAELTAAFSTYTALTAAFPTYDLMTEYTP